MPAQKPGQSRQDYATPMPFIQAVHTRLGITAFAVDFAADATNTKAETFCDLNIDALRLSPAHWALMLGNKWGWLNPPFSHIEPWAAQCMMTKYEGGSVAFLVPAGVGANWFRDYVDGTALVLALNGRLCFINDWRHTVNPSPRNTTGAFYQSEPLYPKDCLLCLYSPAIDPGFEVWTWGDDVP